MRPMNNNRPVIQSDPHLRPRRTPPSEVLSPGASTSSQPPRIRPSADGHGAPPMSPFPPRLQMMRHIRKLINDEKNHVAGAPGGSKARRQHEKFVGYLKRYEQVTEQQGSSVIKNEQRLMDRAHRAEQNDLANLQAALKPVDKDLKWAQGKLAKREGEKADIEKQLAVLGAKAKGDKGPIRFTEKITDKGVTKRLAEIDLGKAGRSIKGWFTRAPRLDKLSSGDLNTKLGRVKEDIGKLQGWIGEYEQERTTIMQRPRYKRPEYPTIPLPSREQILTAAHHSQTLRRTPFQDPLARPAAPEPPPPGPVLPSAMRPAGPRPAGPERHVHFSDQRPRTPDLGERPAMGPMG